MNDHEWHTVVFMSDTACFKRALFPRTRGALKKLGNSNIKIPNMPNLLLSLGLS